MCGIAGIFNIDGTPVSLNLIKAVTEPIAPCAAIVVVVWLAVVVKLPHV